MKDIPHHMKKLNRRVIRSAHREEMEETVWNPTIFESPPRKQTLSEEKKIAKAKLRKTRASRAPIHLTEEERNRKMKHRVPIFDRNNAAPKKAKPSRKKTPRI